MSFWISIPGHKGLTNTRLIWLLLGICVVVFVIVVVRSPKQADREGVKTEAVQKPVREIAPEKPVTAEISQEAMVPQKKRETYEEPEQPRDDVPEVVTLQARVTGIDPDMEMVMLDGQWYNSASLDLSRVRIGNLVEVTYPKKKIAKGLTLISSIRVIGLPEEETEDEGEPEKEGSKGEKLATEAEVPPEEPTEEEIQEAGTGALRVMEGRVRVIDPDLAVIVVDGITFEAASYDPTGLQTPLFNLTRFQTGDIVRVTYTKEKRGNMAESIELIEPR
jgi:hypothetical protein